MSENKLRWRVSPPITDVLMIAKVGGEYYISFVDSNGDLCDEASFDDIGIKSCRVDKWCSFTDVITAIDEGR